MFEPPPGKRRVIDLLLLAAIVGLGALLLQAAIQRANARAGLRLAKLEAQAIYEALDTFHQRTGGFPPASGPTALRLDSLDPLRKRGYYRGHVTAVLQAGRADAYDSPDDRGLNQEFWLEMTLRDDPRIRLLVVRSDDAPSGGGEWRDGVFLVRHGRLEAL